MKTYKAWASQTGYHFCIVSIKAENIKSARKYFADNGYVLGSKVYLFK